MRECLQASGGASLSFTGTKVLALPALLVLKYLVLLCQVRGARAAQLARGAPAAAAACNASLFHFVRHSLRIPPAALPGGGGGYAEAEAEAIPTCNASLFQVGSETLVHEALSC